MSWNPAITVTAVVERDGKFLFVEERIGSRLLINQPAGHVEPGESLLEAVVRETREETGWRFEPRAFLGAYSWQSETSGNWTLRFAFSGAVGDFDPQVVLDEGIVCALWLTPADIERRRHRLRTPLVSQCLADHLAGRRLPLAAVASVTSAVQALDRARRA
jgi:8-oxo-dGTP pyrophosphatase MutT (NUDIX family)